MSELSQVLDALQKLAKRIRTLESRGINIGDAPVAGIEYVRKDGLWVVNTGGGGYTLPTASAATLGGVKIGARITILAGVISADLQGDLFGPGVAVDEDIPLFDTATGKLLKDSGIKIADLEPAKGADDNYVTNAEKTVIGNTSGVNSGDQVGDGTSITGTGFAGTPFVAHTDVLMGQIFS
jgi:hypothetical protein